MKEYIKYQHLEKLGSDDVDGIMLGEVYIFPKIDGTNAHAWFDGESMRYGSRKREVSIDSDNARFMAEMVCFEPLINLCKEFPCFHIYGEWLVPHSLKTYKDSAWRKFYVFDIVSEDGKYLHYDDIRDSCEAHGVEYIPPIKIIKNPTLDNIMRELKCNQFLINDGEGDGEGIVLKNYNFVNKFGRITWAKLVTNEFKEKHSKEMGAPICCGTAMVEDAIVDKYVTKSLVDKTVAKIKIDMGGWSGKCIPRLLSTVFHDLVIEHTWDACKDHKFPTIDFKNLQRFCIMKIKEHLPDIF